MFTESDVRQEIDEILKNKGWFLQGDKKNVWTEKNIKKKRIDYFLETSKEKKPIIVIEAKKKNKDLNLALQQAKQYSILINTPICFATDGNFWKSWHIKENKPLILNDEELDNIIDENLAIEFIKTNKLYTIRKEVINSRQKLINIFNSANDDLRNEGLRSGIERFNEFCTIIFLKLFSEQQENIINNKEIHETLLWNYWKEKESEELLRYINDSVIKNFQEKYGTEIFYKLKIKNSLNLKKIVDKLNSLILSDIKTDIKGDAFEYFLKVYLTKQNQDLGEYFTPRHIVKFMVKLINPNVNEKIYDPFCGTGGMLIESFKHIYEKMNQNDSESLQFLKKKTIYGGEVTSNARITKMNMILTGDGHNNIKMINSLLNPISEEYNVCITNMPFSLKKNPECENKYYLKSSNSNSLCIEHCFKSIKKNGRIAIIIPHGILFDNKYTKLREFIYKNSYVKYIISLPIWSFKPYAWVKSDILILENINNQKNYQKEIWCFEIENDGYTKNSKREKKEGENDFDKFIKFKDNEEKIKLKNGFQKLEIEKIKNNKFISLPNVYQEFTFDNSYELVELGELLEEMIKRNSINAPIWSITNNSGFVPSEEFFSEQVASKNTNNYKIVSLNNFAYSNYINIEGNLSLCLNESDKIGCISPIYTVFRIKDETKIFPQFLFYLFQSEQFKEQVNYYMSFGTVRQTLSWDNFCRIKIPVFSLINQKKTIEQLNKIEKNIKNSQQIINNLNNCFLFFLIDNNENYLLKKISDVCIINPSKKIELNNKFVDFLPMEDLNANSLYTTPKKNKNINEILKKGYTYFTENDLVLAKITPCFENGKMSIIKNLTNKIGFGSGHFFVLREKNISIEWIYYCLKNQQFLQEGKKTMTGSSGRQIINFKFIANYLIPIPSKEIQNKFIDELKNNEKNKNNLFIFIENQKKAKKEFLENIWKKKL